jgi:hypothetical protein
MTVLPVVIAVLIVTLVTTVMVHDSLGLGERPIALFPYAR